MPNSYKNLFTFCLLIIAFSTCSKINGITSKRVVLNNESQYDSLKSYLTIYKNRLEVFKEYENKVLIVPGGSFSRVVWTEGYQAAQWFLKQGIQPYVLNYRHSPDFGLYDALEDIQQALDFIHQDSDKESDTKIGLAGFSAGGYLSAYYALKWEKSKNLDLSYLVLAYPVLSMIDSLTHQHTRINIFKDTLNQFQKERFSIQDVNEERLLPIFLFHSQFDPMVKVDASKYLMQSINEFSPKSKLLLFEQKNHGINFFNGEKEADWTINLKKWLKEL